MAQYISATATALTLTLIADTDVACTGMSLVVPAGRWLLGYNVCAGLSQVAVLGNNTGVRVRMFNTTAGAVVANSEALCSTVSTNAATRITRFSAGRSVYIDLAAQATFQVRVACSDGAAAAVAFVDHSSIAVPGTLTNPDNQSVIWALRQP